MITPPAIPWQVTGNHWLAIPCIHPADGSIHALSIVSQALRGSVEFAGGPGFADGSAPPLLRIALAIDGAPVEPGAGRMTWQRVSEWLPVFTSTLHTLTVRATIFAPYGRGSDFPGLVYALSIENTGPEAVRVQAEAGGLFGWLGHRVRTGRPLARDCRCDILDDGVLLHCAPPEPQYALAVVGDGMVPRPVGSEPGPDSTPGGNRWLLQREASLEPGAAAEFAIYLAAAPERDGARSMAACMRQRGWRALANATRDSLSALQQTTGVPAVDRLVNRHLVFAYFNSAVRAMDDARWYVVRSRLPWNPHGMTIRDWDALMWIVPAIQLADPDLGRELLLRTCDLHGYAPGRGVNYLDGAPFDFSQSTAAAAAYAVAIDRYVTETGDERIVEDPAAGEALYASSEEISTARNPSVPLYASVAAPSGCEPPLPYMLHTNAIVAYALDVLRHTLDEKTGEQVESGDAVRAAILRQFGGGMEIPAVLASAVDLAGASSEADDPVGSVYWIPLYRMLSRDSSVYRRTVRELDSAGPPVPLAARCAELVGPAASEVLEWLRRAELDNGLAAEWVRADGLALANGGDSALSGLLAHSVWYAVNVLGARVG